MKNAIQEIEAQIDTLSSKGNGLGAYQRLDGATASAQVPFTLPGEKVRAALIKKRRGVAECRLVQILNPSPARIAPKCQHFGECGGCRFQHISYAAQLENKAAGIAALFPFYGPLIAPIIGSPLIWGYRNKMEFSFSSDKAGTRYLGLVKAFGHQRVVDLQECHLVSPWFSEAVEITRNWWKETDLPAFKGRSGVLRTLTVREGQQTGDRLVMLTYSGEIHSLDKWVNALKALDPVSIYVREQRAEKGVATEFHQTLLHGPQHIREIFQIDNTNLEFLISPTAFFQPNPKQAENLISIALQMAAVTPDHLVFDLYCGTGTLGICAAKKARQVIGIEVCEEAVEDAKKNAERNQLQNYAIYPGTVRSVLAGVPLPAPDLVFVNPPRSGLESETIAWLIEAKPKKILYISCNPKTQQQDVERLVGGGYQVCAIQPVDQFPHTVHVENIILLSL